MSKLVKTIKDIKINRGLLVTPRMIEYLTTNSSITVDGDLLEVISDILTDTSNSQRTGRFGASSRGDCLRRQVFQYAGAPALSSADYQLHNIFIDGTWRHIRWQAMGLAAGVFTHVEVPFTHKKYNLKGSIDAINEDEGWIFELKGAHTIPKEIPRKHLLQIHTYFLATGYRKCSYLVECKRTQEWREWIVVEDPLIMDEVRTELEQLNKAVDLGVLPEPLYECTQKEGAYKRCPYRGGCIHQQRIPYSGEWDT